MEEQKERAELRKLQKLQKQEQLYWEHEEQLAQIRGGTGHAKMTGGEFTTGGALLQSRLSTLFSVGLDFAHGTSSSSPAIQAGTLPNMLASGVDASVLFLHHLGGSFST